LPSATYLLLAAALTFGAASVVASRECDPSCHWTRFPANAMRSALGSPLYAGNRFHLARTSPIPPLR
jgi:hypothetical protein